MTAIRYPDCVGRGYEQMTLFAPADTALAVCCEDGAEKTARRPEPWVLALVPEAEWAIDWGRYRLALRPVPLLAEDVPQGHRYYHYTIGRQVFSGVFVGRETC